MLWAQILLLVNVFACFLLAAYEHGKPRTGVNNFFVSFIANAFIFLMLCLAGAFDKIFQ